MAAAPTPLFLRLVRVARVVVHLLHGLLITSLVFPWLSTAKRDASKRRWSKKLLDILSVSVRVHNAPHALPDRCVLVLNHISWVDIFVINARSPATFIAKSEIRDWPFVGWLCTLVGTLYIERGKPSAAKKATAAIVAELRRNSLIAVFPEGTTTFGRNLEPFHAALFQPALDADATLHPIALRYFDRTGARSDAAAFVGETTFVESMWTLVSARHIIAELQFLPAVPVSGETRRSLAEKTESTIATALGVPPPSRPQRKAPG